jgi:site-specific recombinase XerD
MTFYVPSLTTLPRVSAVWLEVKRPGWARRTNVGVRASVARFCEILGPIEVKDIDFNEIERYVNFRRWNGIRPKTIRTEVDHLRMLLRWCVDNQIISKSNLEKLYGPARKLRHQQRTDVAVDQAAGGTRRRP